MELKELTEEIAKAILDGHDASREKNKKHQSRWFEEQEDGVKKEIREVYEISGEKIEFAKIAFEDIHSIAIKEVSIELGTPEIEIKRERKGVVKLVLDLFSKKEGEKNLNKITVSTERVEPPPGLIVLQRMAAREVKEHYHYNHPNLANIILYDEQPKPKSDISDENANE